MGKGVLGASGASTWPVLGGGKIKSVNEQLLETLQEMEKKQTSMEKLLRERRGKGTGKGGYAPNKAGGWDCVCGFHNCGFRGTCRECGKARKGGSQGGREKDKTGGNPLQNSNQGPKGGSNVPETEQERRMSIAKAMHSTAKTLPDGPEKDTLLQHWEAEVKGLKEQERKTHPLSAQLKSALDRVNAREKAAKEAAEALAEAAQAHEKAKKEDQEAKEALASGQEELIALQREAAAAGGGQMDVDQGGDQNEGQLGAIEVKLAHLAEILKKVMENPAAVDPTLKAEVSSLLGGGATGSGGGGAPSPQAQPPPAGAGGGYGKEKKGESEAKKGVSPYAIGVGGRKPETEEEDL